MLRYTHETSNEQSRWADNLNMARCISIHPLSISAVSAISVRLKTQVLTHAQQLDLKEASRAAVGVCRMLRGVLIYTTTPNRSVGMAMLAGIRNNSCVELIAAPELHLLTA
jgi:hypothetical protein